MFTKAGFNMKHRTVLYARAWHRGLPVWARMISFIPSGDLAWYSSAVGVTWALSASAIHSHILLGRVAYTGERSLLPRRQR